MAAIGFIGGGNMAEALIKGILAAELYKPSDILVSDIKDERLDYLVGQYRVAAVRGNSELAGKVQIVVLSVKPQNMTEALESIKKNLGRDSLVISIAAGKTIAGITAILGERAVVRVMPNTPALIGAGVSALCANEKAKVLLDKVEAIFAAVGQVVVIDDEGLMDAVTAVSGSGPAYYFLLMEEMIKAAKGLGLPETIAKTLVLQTAKGAALLAEDADKIGHSPGELRKNITSPGGTTEAALKMFAEHKFSEIVQQAVTRARDRGRELQG